MIEMIDLFKNETDDSAGCSIGLLIIKNVKNDAFNDNLNTAREALEIAIRSKYSPASKDELKALHPMDTYVAYYKGFGYSYHVLAQLESVIKGKSIPSGFSSVEAMFMAELKNMLLTAGHDFDKIRLPLSLKCASGNETYITMSGKTVSTVSKDFILADQDGTLSSILRGPDQKTAISKQTTCVIYTVYAPFGVDEQLVLEHLRDIEAYNLMASEEAVTQFLGMI